MATEISPTILAAFGLAALAILAGRTAYSTFDHSLPGWTFSSILPLRGSPMRLPLASHQAFHSTTRADFEPPFLIESLKVPQPSAPQPLGIWLAPAATMPFWGIVRAARSK